MSVASSRIDQPIALIQPKIPGDSLRFPCSELHGLNVVLCFGPGLYKPATKIYDFGSP